jgi:hypothetical protein
MYADDDIITIAKRKTTAREIWDYDAKKAELARQTGYTFVVIWESDIVDMSDEEVLRVVRRTKA